MGSGRGEGGAGTDAQTDAKVLKHFLSGGLNI